MPGTADGRTDIRTRQGRNTTPPPLSRPVRTQQTPREELSSDYLLVQDAADVGDVSSWHTCTALVAWLW